MLKSFLLKSGIKFHFKRAASRGGCQKSGEAESKHLGCTPSCPQPSGAQGSPYKMKGLMNRSPKAPSNSRLLRRRSHHFFLRNCLGGWSSGLIPFEES